MHAIIKYPNECKYQDSKKDSLKTPALKGWKPFLTDQHLSLHGTKGAQRRQNDTHTPQAALGWYEWCGLKSKAQNVDFNIPNKQQVGVFGKVISTHTETNDNMLVSSLDSILLMYK